MSRRRKLGRVTRDRWFESGFLQQRVLLGSDRASDSRSPRITRHAEEQSAFFVGKQRSANHRSPLPSYNYPSGLWTPVALWTYFVDGNVRAGKVPVWPQTPAKSGRLRQKTRSCSLPVATVVPCDQVENLAIITRGVAPAQPKIRGV